MTSATPTITRRDLGAGLVAYVMNGTVNGEHYADELLIQSSRVHYSHASITTLTDGTEVVSLHKSDAAAAKGNGQIARRYHASVVVVVIADEAPEAVAEPVAEPVTRQALRDALSAHNEAYRTQVITRAEWVAGNRRLAEQGAPLGMTLPAFALADDDAGREQATEAVLAEMETPPALVEVRNDCWPCEIAYRAELWGTTLPAEPAPGWTDPGADAHAGHETPHRVTYGHGYDRVSRTFPTIAAARVFIDANAMVYRLPAVEVERA